MVKVFGPKRLVLLVAATMLLLLPMAAEAAPSAPVPQFETKAQQAVLMDYDTGMVLFQKNADMKVEPASLAKLMTLAVVFDQLRQKRITLNDEFFISEHAWRDGGAKSGSSTMFAVLNSKIRVEDLIKSVIIQSGNDAAIALAEGVAGTEETFAAMENQLAQKIGLTNSNFTNASGLPDPAMLTTARDLGNLARYLIREYPEYYPIFSQTEFTWNKIKQPNRNSLLEMGIGVDGLKTGHSEEAGYGSVVSTAQGGRRLIAVLHGLTSMKERAEEGRKLLTWGTRGFDRIPVFPKGQVVGFARVYGGEASEVGLIGQSNIDLFVPKGASNCPQANIVYKGPLRPPVDEGAKVAELRVMCNGQLVQTAPLFTQNAVAPGGLMRKAEDALKQLALGWL
jgi:D-alanyl-D-alanine carboxypeptidase (penicillin-binding protein 5/6)